MQKGKIEFYETDIEFQSSIGNNRFMIDESYFDKLVHLSKFISNLSILLKSGKGGYHEVTYSNCIVSEIYRTTNFPGKMEVVFSIGIPIEKVREMKLGLLICD
jgi:hypothetical protein